jgi:hypothetical protein
MKTKIFIFLAICTICLLLSKNTFAVKAVDQCVPDVIAHGTMVPGVEGGCWIFKADDGTSYEPWGGPAWMYVNGLTGTMYAVGLPGAVSICMEGIIVEVCNFEIDGCMDNSDCLWWAQYCEKPVGFCDGPGMCTKIPEICPFLLDPVCGCDGVTYPNDCVVAMNSASIAYYGSCTCPGDFDHDGDVDGSDLTVFAADFGHTNCAVPTPCEGDFDRDGDVDGSDLAIFAADFGRTDCP